MKYAVRHTSAFKRDYKLMLRRHLPIQKLQTVVAKLANGEELPPENHDHPLIGNWAHHRACHIAPTWRLIHQLHDDILILELTRTGSHSDLF